MEEGKNQSQISGDALAKCEALRDEYLDGWKRAKADLINYKKEEEQRFREFAKIANESLVEELLAVIDSFELGLRGVSESDHGHNGLLIIRSQFEDILKRFGLEQIAVAPGEKFNPAVHEALSGVPSEKPVGTVVEEARKGYSLNGKILRPAQVVISKGQDETLNNIQHTTNDE